jgi:hypothetical protein
MNTIAKYILRSAFLLLLAWGGFAIFWGWTAASNPQEGLRISVKIVEIIRNGYVIPGIVIYIVIMMTAAFLPMTISSLRRASLKRRLAKTGQRMMARILEIRDTGVTMNQNPYIEVQVDIRPGIETWIACTVSRVSIPRPGDSIEILYDPLNPRDAVIAPK